MTFPSMIFIKRIFLTHKKGNKCTCLAIRKNIQLPVRLYRSPALIIKLIIILFFHLCLDISTKLAERSRLRPVVF